MSARRAAFEKIESALGDSVRRVGGVGGVDLGFRPDPGVDLWIPLKVQRPIPDKRWKYVSWNPKIERHLVLVHEDGQVGIALSSASQKTRVYLHNTEMIRVTYATLHAALSEYTHLCRSWEAVELMCPLHRKRQEKKALKVVAETSAVNKTVRRVFEEQGLGKHLVTIGGKCGADFAFFPDPLDDACLGIKVSATGSGKSSNVSSYTIDKTLPYLFLAVSEKGVAMVPVREITPRFNTLIGRSKFGLQALSRIPEYVQRMCRDMGETNGLCLVSLSNVLKASNPAVKFMNHNSQEAQGQDLVESCLPAGLWSRTEEFCYADAIYGPHSAQNLLPIQIKTSTVTTKSEGYRFTLNHRYDSMLVLCIHLPSRTIYAVPGALLPDKTFCGKFLGGTDDGNQDYIVQPDELASFLESLYAAVSAGTSNGSWPTQTLKDVSAMRMVTREEANIPRGANQRKAQEYANFRRTLLTGLMFAPPRVQHTPVDIMLNGKRIQDKLASVATRTGSNGWRCTLSRKSRTRGVAPYRDKDFDFLWIHIDRTLFYLIPASVLASHGILSSLSSKGATSIYLYPFGCAKDADLWTDAFKLSYKDPGIEDKIRSILALSENSNGPKVPDATTCDQSRQSTHKLM